jgi:type II secretory pathway component PulC
MKNLYQDILVLAVISGVLAGGTTLYYRRVLSTVHRFAIKDRHSDIPAAKNTFPRKFSQENITPIDKEQDSSPLSNNIPPSDLKRAPMRGNRALDLALRGTVGGVGLSKYAILEDMKTQSQGLYRVGDRIHGGHINDIQKEKVIIHFQGNDITLQVQGRAYSDGVARRTLLPSTGAGESLQLEKADIEKAIPDASQLASQVRFRPRDDVRGAGGLEITDIEEGSIPDKLGLEPGDIILEVNGIAITNPRRIVSMIERMKLYPVKFSFGEKGIENLGDILALDQGDTGLFQGISSLAKQVEEGNEISITLMRKGTKRKFNYTFK